jgi:rSAM/selenodomain-associated transferase 1
MMPMPRVTLYTKPGCGLCEEAEEAIEAVRARCSFEFIKRNILEDLEDYQRYRHEIPVIFVEDREIARHHLEESQLRTALIMRDTAVVIMARVPEPGRVKTRLMPDLTAEQAAGVYEQFLRHLVFRIDQMGFGELIICHDPPDAIDCMRHIVGQETKAGYWPQIPGDLGAKLADAARAEARNRPQVLFLGVDSPDVPDEYLRRVAQLLDSHDVVIGPAEDGGYWTIALRSSIDAGRLFAGIEWSSGREFDQTVAAARRLGYKVGLADRWHDVDRPVDLRGLIERLRVSANLRDRHLLGQLDRLR